MAIFFFTKILQTLFIENIRQDDITLTQQMTMLGTCKHIPTVILKQFRANNFEHP